MRQLILIFASLLAGCGLILDHSPPDQRTLGVSDGSVDATTDAEPPVACVTAADCEADPCRGVPTCVEGVCDFGEWKDCSALDHEVCVKGVCVEGECVQMPKDNYCDDGFECTVGVCAEDGSCAFEPSHELCDDGVACTVDYCAPGNDVGGAASGCVHVPDDSVCAGRIPAEGYCVESVCTESAETEDRSGCATAIVPDACESNAYCAVESGVCKPFVTGCQSHEQCDDGNECNGEEFCLDGTCFRGGDACPISFNPCLEAVCTIVDGGAVCDYRTIEGCVTIVDPIPIGP